MLRFARGRKYIVFKRRKKESKKESMKESMKERKAFCSCRNRFSTEPVTVSKFWLLHSPFPFKHGFKRNKKKRFPKEKRFTSSWFRTQKNKEKRKIKEANVIYGWTDEQKD